jgi:hypothetical protein
MSKPYSPTLNGENDKRGREALKAYWRNEYGRVLTEDPDGEKRVDLFDPVDGTYLEVEIKKDWKEYSFPFDDIRITYRKLKYVILHPSLWFWTLNNILTRAAVVAAKTFMAAPVVEIEVRADGFENGVGKDSFKVIPIQEIDRWVDLRKPEIVVDQSRIQDIEMKSCQLWTDDELAMIAAKYHVRHGERIEWE